jgi:eukaryotic-like serine/threonine-protein kinase
MTRVVAILLAVLALLLLVPAIRHLREQPPPPPPAIRLSLPSPAGVESGFADETLDAAISPDESAIVFVATDLRADATGQHEGVRRLWRRSLASERAEPLPGTEGAQQPAWKPTGNVIAFFADGRLKQLTLSDGVIHDLAAAQAANGAAWLADGSLLFATGAGSIRRLRDGQTTEATSLGPGDLTHAFPAAGRSGEIIYIAVREDGRRVVRALADGNERDLTTTSGHAAMAGSSLLHVRDGTLLAYERDAETGALSPRGTPLALGVGVSSNGRALFAASPQLLLHAPAAARAMELVWLDQSGARQAGLGDTGDYWQVRLSPDDGMAAVSSVDPLLRALDVVLVPTAGGTARQFTLALAPETDPVWSPDGMRVLFRSLEGGSPDLFVRGLEQKEPANEAVLRSDGDETPTDWARGQVLFHARGKTGLDVMRLEVASGQVSAMAATPFNERDARWSPDGRWVAFVSDESGQPDVYAMSGTTRLRVSFAGGTKPRWTRDGRAIVFLRDSQVMRADLSGASTFSRAEALFEAPGIRDFDLAHRGDRILALLPVKPGSRGEVSAVLNWRGVGP